MNTQIHIFKTNIQDETDLSVIQANLGSHESIYQWSVDLGDCDKVLRVVSHSLSMTDITVLVESCGFECVELTY